MKWLPGGKIFCVITLSMFMVQTLPISAVAGKAETIEQTETAVVTDVKSLNPDFKQELVEGNKTYVLEDIEHTIASEKPETTKIEKSVVVTSPPFIKGGTYEQPAASYLCPEDGLIYELQDYKVVDVLLEKRSKPVEHVMYYENVEQADGIPKTCELEVYDDVLREYIKKNVPLSEVLYENYYWDNTFEFPVNFYEYDANYYAMGDILIPRDDLKPALKGHEKELLKLIGLNEKFYKIEAVMWASDPFTNEDGIVCRTANAVGSRLVGNCKAVYRGTVMLAATAAQTTEASYFISLEEETGKTVYTVNSTATYRLKGSVKGWFEQLLDWLWKFITSPAGIVSIALIFLLLFLILLLFILKKKKKEEATNREENHENRYGKDGGI